MVSRSASTVAQYLASLPADRRGAIAKVREVVNARLPPGYEETMQYGMISWIVPRSRLAATYNGQPLALASLGSQKQYMALYLMTVYGDGELAAWFRAAYRAAGKTLDMGKSCVRFKTLDALPLDVIGEAIARVPVEAYVAMYEASRSKTVKPKAIEQAAAAPARPAATKHTTTKHTTTKRTTTKHTTTKHTTTKHTTTKRTTAKHTTTKRTTAKPTTKHTTTKHTTTKRTAAKHTATKRTTTKPTTTKPTTKRTAARSAARPATAKAASVAGHPTANAADQ